MVIYPNPTTGIINLEISGKSTAMLDVDVFDKHGQLVKHYESKRGLQFMFDMSDCSAGDYFVRVYTSGRILTRKVELLPKPIF